MIKNKNIFWAIVGMVGSLPCMGGCTQPLPSTNAECYKACNNTANVGQLLACQQQCQNPNMPAVVKEKQEGFSGGSFP